MDALKYVLHAVRLSPQLFKRETLVAPWSQDRQAVNMAAYHFVEEGHCFLQSPYSDERIELVVGDLVVISNTAHYTLLNDTHQSNSSTCVLNGEFCSERNIPYPIFSLLPPVIHIPNQNGQPVLWLGMGLQTIANEASEQQPGYQAVVSRLMDIFFIMVMRTWIDQHTLGEGGWLGALYDPHIGQTLNAIHTQPDKPWSLEKLAHMANMSRSVFAERFREMVGESPMRYLTKWRIQVATTWLGDYDDLTIEQVAHRVGYTSQFAFSKAFKRLTGISPSEYREGL